MQKKILLILATVFVIWLFMEGISILFYERYNVFLTISGAIVAAFLLGAVLTSFLNPTKNRTTTPDGKKMLVIMVVPLAFAVIYGITLFNHRSFYKEKEFREYGQLATATVVDGKTFRPMKGGFSSIRLEYNLTDGTRYFTDIDVSAREFNEYKVNRRLPIVYSTKYPAVVRVLKSEKEALRYSKTKMKDITLADLTHLFELKQNENTYDYLNSISQQWDYANNYYINGIKCVSVRLNHNKSLAYIYSMYDPELFSKELAQGNYKPIDFYGDKGFENDKYRIFKKVYMNANDEGFIKSDSITVVSIINKAQVKDE